MKRHESHPGCKTYYAASVEAAIALARRELGEDALLIDSRTTSPQESALGAYQVRFQPPEPEPATAAAAAPSAAPESAGPDLRAELASLTAMVSEFAARAGASSVPPALMREAHRLSEAGMPREVAEPLLAAVSERLGGLPPASPLALRRALATELESRLSTCAPFSSSQRQVAALVGPPGVGKTTTLVKLALRLGVAARRPTAIISIDTQRIAAADQLRACASIAGIPFQTAETEAALSSLLAEYHNKQLVLIDTPGLGPREADDASACATLFRSLAVECHLVLPATLGYRAFRRAFTAWRDFSPSSLILTQLDIAAESGAVVAASLAGGPPLSFFSTGQAIPEDLEPAARSRLLQLLLDAPPAALAARA